MADSGPPMVRARDLRNPHEQFQVRESQFLDDEPVACLVKGSGPCCKRCKFIVKSKEVCLAASNHKAFPGYYAP